MGTGCYWKSPKLELTYIIILLSDEKHILYILSLYNCACTCKTCRQFYLHKSVCPIYVYDTKEYVGSAFFDS